MDIDELMQELRDMILDDSKVVFTHKPYREFHSNLLEYVYQNHLQDQEEWKTISENLVYYSNQYMTPEEANTILSQLEKMKRKVLTRKYEPFWSYIHAQITDVAKDSYINQDYANSVESAFKEIEVRVRRLYKNKTGIEKSGVSLMRDAFTFKKDNGTQKITKQPCFVIEELDTQIGQDVQEGYMQLFAGAMQGIRNPKAHSNMRINQDQAIHRLMFASLLMYKLDEVEGNKR